LQEGGRIIEIPTSGGPMSGLILDSSFLSSLSWDSKKF